MEKIKGSPKERGMALSKFLKLLIIRRRPMKSGASFKFELHLGENSWLMCLDDVACLVLQVGMICPPRWHGALMMWCSK